MAHSIVVFFFWLFHYSCATYILSLCFFFFFFFVYSLYSYATYIDHDEYYVQSVSPPQSACSGTVQAPFWPPPRPIPQGAST